MAEKLKQLPVQLLNQWNKYSNKQKTIIISVIAIVFLALIILVNVMNQVEYTKLIENETTKDASTVAELLEAEEIPYKLGDDAITIYVDKNLYSDALLLVYGSDVSTSGITLEDLMGNDLSTTNSDRTLKQHLYIQTELRKYLMTMTGIQDAQVTYVPTDNSYSVLTEQKDYPASVALTIDDDFKLATAEAVAELVAAAIGNESTDKIKVIDQNGNLLFGGNEDLYSGSATSVLEYREKLQNTYNNNIYMLMMKLGYDDVQPMFNWSLNMDKVNELYVEQIPAEGSDQGYYKNYYSYEAENASGSSGVPGTDSNDETTYLVEDSSDSSSTVTTTQIEYYLSERTQNIEYEVGAVIPEESTGSIVATRVVTYKEEDLELQGLLEGTTFDEYVLANSDRKQLDVGEDVYKLVSLATGIATENIVILAYEQPVFIAKVVEARDWSFYISIVLAVLIIALLVFVVFRATSPVEITELEPELSVEQLLATTKENQSLDDIEFSEKSETKKMIEKFVDEKPEAVAQLLRNWLNEDWG